MSKNLLVRFALSVAILSCLLSCESSKHLAYFQDLKDTSTIQILPIRAYEPLKLQMDDQVQIVVSSTAPEAAQYFNLSASASGSSSAGSGSQSSISVYSVSPSGYITLPVLGDIYVVGMTTEELKQKVFHSLTAYIKDVIVSVRLVNFKVTVIGEIGHPVTVPGNGERLTALEAIGAAGDMTAFSKRFNVKIMRKIGDTVEVAHLNFNTSKMLQSPFYQLKQNDVVYVEPNETKGFRNERFTIVLPFIVSITSFLLTISTLFIRLKI